MSKTFVCRFPKLAKCVVTWFSFGTLQFFKRKSQYELIFQKFHYISVDRVTMTSLQSTIYVSMFNVAADMLWVNIVQNNSSSAMRANSVFGTAKVTRNIGRRLTSYIKPHVTTMLSIPTRWRRNEMTTDMMDSKDVTATRVLRNKIRTKYIEETRTKQEIRFVEHGICPIAQVHR